MVNSNMAGRRILASVEERYEPTGLGAAMEDPSTAVRLILVLLTVNFGNALISGVFVATLAGEPTVRALALAGAAGYGLALVVFVLTGRGVIAIVAWVSLMWSVSAHIALGGYLWSGGWMLWGIAVTISTAIWLNRRTTYIQMGIWAATAIVLAFLEADLRSSRDQPELWYSVFLLVNILIMTMVFSAPAFVKLLDQLLGEQARSGALMLNILPATVAARLKEESGVIADQFEECTVLFGDIVGFTSHASGISPSQVVNELNAVFTAFDRVVNENGAEKIKTIGDGYMVVCGIPEPVPNSAVVGCAIALGMMQAVEQVNRTQGTDFSIRIGINSGPVVAGVIGTSKFSYDVWGDTVNVASRLESSGQPGMILASAEVVDRTNNIYEFGKPRLAELKGHGQATVTPLLGVKGSNHQKPRP